MRLIDADALLEKFKENDCGMGFSDFEIYAFITNAPTVQREGWVSVKDRLPNNGQNVIAIGTWFGEINGRGESEYTGIGTWEGNRVCIDSDTYSTEIIEVTHWQPLPAPPADKEE